MTTKNKTTFKPQVEGLEDRALMAASVNLVGGNIVIRGTNAADKVSVETRSYGFAVVDFSGSTRVIGAYTTAQVRSGGLPGKIYFYGNASGDYFGNNTSLRAYADGGAGDDRLYGGSNSDVLFGNSGKDVVSGEGGNDYLFGGSGVDTVLGGAGADYLDGGGTAGKDAVRDILKGGTNADRFVRDRTLLGRNLDAPADFSGVAGDKVVEPSASLVDAYFSLVDRYR